MIIPHPIPYQGSKRNIAMDIINYIPKGTKRLIEPFAGSAAISFAAAYYGKVESFILNDANEPLIKLWENIINHPDSISESYQEIWNSQTDNDRHYYTIRDLFNKTKKPEYLLYLLARCVKASVRYNANGEFNQSPDNRRLGTNPSTMRSHIKGASELLRNKVDFYSKDYRELLDYLKPEDVIYMDPPYQGVCAKRDQRYIKGVSFYELVDFLEQLRNKGIPFIVSYDGRTGDKSFGNPLPKHLNLERMEIHAGRSTQATLLGRDHITYESLYISPTLLIKRPKRSFVNHEQIALF